MDFGTRKIRLVQKGGEWREIDITPATPVPPGHDGSQTYSATLRLWNLATVIVASALAFLMAGPAYALIIPCETFDRSNTGAAQPVRDYLDDSKGLFVRVCGGGDHLLYFGASNIVRDGNVCRYSEYGLNLSRTSPPRLERTAKPPQTYMLVSESETCPTPEAIKYAATNNVPQDVFEHLLHFWHDAIASR